MVVTAAQRRRVCIEKFMRRMEELVEGRQGVP